MTIESLLVLPKPEVIERVFDRVQLKGADETCATKAREWLNTPKRAIRYDILDGKMPIVVFTDLNGSRLPIPEFLGVKMEINREQIEIHNLDSVYKPQISKDSFCITYFGDSFLSHFGNRYEYSVSLKDSNIESISAEVKNRYVFGDEKLQKNRPRGISTAIEFYKFADGTPNYRLALTLKVDNDNVILIFGNSHNLQEAQINGEYHRADELEEMATLFNGKICNSPTLRNLQSVTEKYQKAMLQFRRRFGEVKNMDYESILNRSVEH